MAGPQDKDAVVVELLRRRREQVRKLAFHLVRTFVLVNIACIAIIGCCVEIFPREAKDLGPFLALAWLGANLVTLGWGRKRSHAALELRMIDRDLERLSRPAGGP